MTPEERKEALETAKGLDDAGLAKLRAGNSVLAVLAEDGSYPRELQKILAAETNRRSTTEPERWSRLQNMLSGSAT